MRVKEVCQLPISSVGGWVCAHLSVISQLLPHTSRLRLQQRMRVVSVLVVLAYDAHECAAFITTSLSPCASKRFISYLSVAMVGVCIGS